MRVLNLPFPSEKAAAMVLHKLFCDVDDFFAVFIPEWHRTRLQDGRNKCNTSNKGDAKAKSSPLWCCIK
jgi:hypothetical protein